MLTLFLKIPTVVGRYFIYDYYSGRVLPLANSEQVRIGAKKNRFSYVSQEVVV